MKKNLFLSILFSAAIIILPTQSMYAKSIFNTIKGNKKIVYKEVKVADYSSISLYNSADVIYEQKESTAPYLMVEIDENLFEYLDIQVADNNLILKQKSSTSISPSKYIIRTNSKQLENVNIFGSGNISTKGKLKSSKINLLIKGSGDLFAEELDTNSLSATVEGSGDIKSTGATKANTVNLFVKGSGDINFPSLVTSSISAEVKGSGDIKINGKATNAQYIVAGSGDIKAKGLVAETVTCNIVGSGDIEVNSTQNLECNIKGSGDIYYLGNPSQVQKNIKGSGDIKKVK